MLVATTGDTTSAHGRLVSLSSMWLLEAGWSGLASLGVNYVAHVLTVLINNVGDRNFDTVVEIDVILGA